MMVCSYDESRLLLVLQIDHSHVAGQLAAHWGNDQFAAPRPYASMVLAAQEHDSGWWDWEIRPDINDQGYPPDYIGSMGADMPLWLNFQRHGTDRVAEQDPYAGYIVSMHTCGLLTKGMGLLPYMPDYSGDAGVKEYLEEQELFRQNILQHLRSSEESNEDLSDEHLWNNFKLMEVYDQMAQFICNRYPLNSSERKSGPTSALSNTPVPVAPGREDVTVSVDVQDESWAIVKPYPFDVDPLVIDIPGRVVPKGPYTTQDDFLDHFYKAERVIISYKMHSG